VNFQGKTRYERFFWVDWTAFLGVQARNDAKLTSKIGAGFSLATSFSRRYDNEPLPGKEKLDTITAINLVYKIL
jgi:putative salt-induced outer membrane protein YdiY